MIIACSTKKNRLINREFQALNTKFNVLYNGNVALDKGIIDLKSQYKDNFWEILPIERMQILEEDLAQKKAKNANFDRAEEKATKSIQKRSMNIDGREKNPQMDEGHLLLGKSRYYEQRFIPALEAFNYILYKYPESDKIYEAKIWREKTNMRLDNDALAVKNLKKLLKDYKFKNQVFADANAALAQAFLNLNQKDSAVICIKTATTFTKSSEERARYRYILGQLYEQLSYKDSAFVAYQSVIDMNRNAPRRYVIQAHARQASQFDYEKGDTLVFLKNFKDLIQNRENRPFLDVLNHEMALFYEKNKKTNVAIQFYNKSLRTKSEDQYLTASNYKFLAKIYFDKAKYQTAGQYYDSTLVLLKPRTKEYSYYKKKRENLVEVIKYEAIAQRNDSILNVMALSPEDKKSFYDDYIAKIKKADEAKLALEKLEKEKLERDANLANNGAIINEENENPGSGNNGILPPGLNTNIASNDATSFYFYNPATVAFGKVGFKKKWGNRSLKPNWRLSSESNNNANTVIEEEEAIVSEEEKKSEVQDPRYTTDFYLKQLPTTQKSIDSLAKDRNFAYYQLGVIYKEKFKEYNLAASKLETLLNENPEERLVLPALYNLFKIYEITNKEKAEVTKNRIITDYPNSRYAQIVSNTNASDDLLSQSPDVVYKYLYKSYESNDLVAALENTTIAIEQFSGEEILPKLELLKANLIGKLKGLSAFKTALNFVALNYPNTEEGKNAEAIVSKEIPILERLNFYQIKPDNWKILYPVAYNDSVKIKALQEKIGKFIKTHPLDKLDMSVDIYSDTEKFVVIYKIISEEYSRTIIKLLKNEKDYKIIESGVVISNENYRVVQVKKALNEYLVTPKSEPVSQTTQNQQTITPAVLENKKPASQPIINNPTDASSPPQLPGPPTSKKP